MECGDEFFVGRVFFSGGKKNKDMVIYERYQQNGISSYCKMIFLISYFRSAGDLSSSLPGGRRRNGTKQFLGITFWYVQLHEVYQDVKMSSNQNSSYLLYRGQYYPII